MNRNPINLFKSLILIASLALAPALLLGCDDSEDDSKDGSETGGSGPDDGSGGTTAGNGGTNGQVDELTECLPQNPPLEDPYCHNPRCPIQLKGVDPANQPKGNCCNTVDVTRVEAGKGEGETYDLEFATMVSLSTNNANLFAPIIEDGTRTRQEAGGDVTLYRLKGVPRSEDIEKDADGNPIPVEVKLEIGAGKLNCDGTYSFFGPNAAPAPLHEEIPDDPSRWKANESLTKYYGPEGVFLFRSDEKEPAASGLRWSPRWQQDGIYLELPLRFFSPRPLTENIDDHLSCIGSIDKEGAWQRAGHSWAFIPAEQGEYSLIPSIGDQSMCGLYAMGAGGGDCADTPRSDWTIQPTAYCNDESFCWVGDSTDNTYAQFWKDFYEGVDGCDETGAGEYPCCDPAGEDANLPACNVFPSLSTFVMGAVEITDDTINDPAEAISWAANCP